MCELSIAEYAQAIRAYSLLMTHRAKTSHIGSDLSVADLLAVLYGTVLRLDPQMPSWQDRDRLLLSKGHASAALYAALALRGFITLESLQTFSADGSDMGGHVSHLIPGVEFSTGSLGHGLPIACGMALAGKSDKRCYRVFTILGEGDCDEGSTWEAALFASHHSLDNMTAIIDHNNLQAFGSTEQVLDLAPLADKWRAFGWQVLEVDGHDRRELQDAFRHLPLLPGAPTMIIASTVKGKGVSFMENRLAWHYKSPNDVELAMALKEIGWTDENGVH